MRQFYVSALLGAAAFGLSACTAGQTGPLAVSSVNPISTNTLKLSVGTANIGGAAVGMNVVATLRQPNGESGVLVSTPHLTGPFTLPAAAPNAAADATLATEATGPSAVEVAGDYIGGTPQSSASNVVGDPTTFGQAGGVFGNGFAPANYTTTGNSYSYAPYDEPIYGATLADGQTFTPWGGVPAYDPDKDGEGTLDGKFPPSADLRGIPLGLNVFANTTVGTGTYTLSVAIPTGGSSTGTLTASSTVASAAVLPTAATPAFVNNGDGTGTLTYVLPAGAVGAYIEATDLSYCGGEAVPYTFWVTASGTSTITNAYGPGNTTAGHHAICTAADNTSGVGDEVQVEMIAFDYNQYALQYNGATGATYPQAPSLPAQADVSISPVLYYPADNSGPTTTAAHARAAKKFTQKYVGKYTH
jgi:hypothetical protein